MKFKTEWRRAPDFAEIAETLGVTTTQIMAASSPESDGPIVALYTPREDEPTRIFSVTLERGTDGVLVAVRVPEEQPGLWEEIIRQVEDDRA